MWYLIIFSVVIIALVLFYLYVSFSLFHYCFDPISQDKMLKKVERQRILNSEAYKFREYLNNLNKIELVIKSDSNNNIKGYLFKQNDNNSKLVILVHGWHSEALLNVSRYGRFYFDDPSYDVLILVQEGHYPSEGSIIGFGVNDGKNIKKWVDEINSRYKNKYDIYLHGVSMGASSCLFSTKYDLPINVKGIIADSGFNNVADQLMHSAKMKYKVTSKLVLAIIRKIVNKKGKFDIIKENTIDALKNTNIPILFIHGRDDDFVPLSMTKKNYDNYNGPKELLIIDEAKHIEGYQKNPTLYKDKISSFINRL